MRVAPGFALDPIDRAFKFHRNAVEIPRYYAIERSFSNDLQGIVAAHLGGDLTAGQAVNRFRERLTQAETEAFVAGRRARGRISPHITEEEAAMLQLRNEWNTRYFSNFVDDMGRHPEPPPGRMPYMKRADLYARSLWSIFTRGESTDWSDDPEKKNARYYWIMQPGAEHCQTCLDRAGMSRDNDGFTWDMISAVGWPGENTLCQVNCRCHIRTVNKRLLLPEKFEDIGPEKTPIEGVQALVDMLGGPHMPRRIPAAGIPFAKMSPEALEASMNAAGANAGELARLLPTIPKVLTTPEAVIDQAETRMYLGHGLVVTVGTDDIGQWRILALLLGASLDPSRLL